MRDPSVLTVAVEVASDQWTPLRRYLKTKVNPGPGGRSGDLKFENYPNLHFLSFCMPPPLRKTAAETPEKAQSEEGTRGLLVMEATFDGPEDAFIRDLVAQDRDALIAIFDRCRGFPRTARENPHLIEIFLKQRTLPSQAFFSGAPGKTVVQIRRERALRRKLGDVLRTAPQDLMAAEPRRLQDHLRRETLKDEDLSLMSRAPTPTRSLQQGDRMMRLAAALLSLPVFLIGALLFCWAALAGMWADLTSAALDRAACYLLIASAVLLALKVARDAAARAAEAVNPKAWPFVHRGLAGGGIMIVRLLMAILAARIVFLLAVRLEDTLWPDHWAAATPVFVIVLACFAIVYAFALFLGAVRASAGRLGCADRTRPDAWWKSVFNWAIFNGFWALFAATLIPLAVLFIVVFGPENAHALWLWSLLVRLIGWFSAGMIVILAIWVLLLKAHDLLQAWENRNLSDPNDLYAFTPEGRYRWADEEHGYQRHQNHYVSLTNVKDGWYRQWLLLLALTIVNFLARYKDNQGTLGGIPTIFSARWALIDNGRRLLFMTNYSGAWDSYLNEFSELASVIGVNMIWTNTYIATDNPRYRPGIRFPRTELFTGRGARATLPFKAYVRRSQLETLVWYGAYRELSVVNVSENGRIREAVFGPTDAAALDLLLKRL